MSFYYFFESAQNRNRTCTSLRTTDFESVASTNSAIWAKPFLNNFREAILRIPSYLSKNNQRIYLK